MQPTLACCVQHRCPGSAASTACIRHVCTVCLSTRPCLPALRLPGTGRPASTPLPPPSSSLWPSSSARCAAAAACPDGGCRRCCAPWQPSTLDSANHISHELAPINLPQDLAGQALGLAISAAVPHEKIAMAIAPLVRGSCGEVAGEMCCRGGALLIPHACRTTLIAGRHSADAVLRLLHQLGNHTRRIELE